MWQRIHDFQLGWLFQDENRSMTFYEVKRDLDIDLRDVYKRWNENDPVFDDWKEVSTSLDEIYEQLLPVRELRHQEAIEYAKNNPLQPFKGGKIRIRIPKIDIPRLPNGNNDNEEELRQVMKFLFSDSSGGSK